MVERRALDLMRRMSRLLAETEGDMAADADAAGLPSNPDDAVFEVLRSSTNCQKIAKQSGI